MKNFVVDFLNENEYEQWDKFVSTSSQGNIFNRTFWLDCVSNKYSILVCRENNNIAGGIVLPEAYRKFYINPKLTPQLGILTQPHNQNAKYSTRISREMEITEAILEKLPKFNHFNYNFSYNFSSFLPFIWNGFTVRPTYTYVIDDLTDIDKVYDNFQYDIKYSIKKTAKNNIKIVENDDINKFYDINKKTFERQNMQMPYSLEMIRKIDSEVVKNAGRKILLAYCDDTAIAGIYLLYDNNCTYYLMGGADPEYKNLGGQTALLWEGIKFASTVSKCFDFEGSSIRGIESYFRGFGGRQKVIYNVYKSNPFIDNAYKFARRNKNLIRKFFKV